MTGRRAIRFVKPGAGRWLKAFLTALVWTYIVMVPVNGYWIQDAGLGINASTHLSIGKVVVGIAMLCLVWTPLMCVWLSPVLLPLAAIVAFVGAGIRRVPAAD